MPFATVDEMILNLPKNEQAIVKRLRSLILECLPLAKEKPYYGLGVPYYSGFRQICYIFPSSALYGAEIKLPKEKNVTLGFCQGNKMSTEHKILKAERRKQVRVIYFHKLGDINDEEIRSLLFEAAMIDDSFGKEKRKRVF
jgi:hypothetical protein